MKTEELSELITLSKAGKRADLQKIIKDKQLLKWMEKNKLNNLSCLKNYARVDNFDVNIDTDDQVFNKKSSNSKFLFAQVPNSEKVSNLIKKGKGCYISNLRRKRYILLENLVDLPQDLEHDKLSPLSLHYSSSFKCIDRDKYYDNFNSESLKVPSQIKYNPKLKPNEKSYVFYKKTSPEKNSVNSSKRIIPEINSDRFESFQLPNVKGKNYINFARQINRSDITKMCNCKPNEERFNSLAIPQISTKYKSIPCFTLYSTPSKFKSYESEIIKITETFNLSKKEESSDQAENDAKPKNYNSPIKAHNEILPSMTNNNSFHQQNNLVLKLIMNLSQIS